MATLLRGEVRAILQPAGHAQYAGAYCPPEVPFREVRRGPFDGKTDIAVQPDTDGAMPRHMTFGGGRVVYEYDGRDQKGRAVYRYAPRLSPSHREVMAGVAEVYAEHALNKARSSTDERPDDRVPVLPRAAARPRHAGRESRPRA